MNETTKEQIVITEKIWSSLLKLLICDNKNYSDKLVNDKINSIETGYNINIKNIVKEFLNYIIRNHPKYITKRYLDFCEALMHIHEINTNYYKKYFIVQSRNVFLLEP